MFASAKFFSTSRHTSSATSCIQTGRTIKSHTELHTINKENARQFHLQNYESAAMSSTHNTSQLKQGPLVTCLPQPINLKSTGDLNIVPNNTWSDNC